MPLHEDHKADIALAIYMTALPDDFTLKTVTDQVENIAKAIRGEPNNIREFSDLFANPLLLKQQHLVETPSDPTYGEAREYIIHYLHDIISTAASDLNKTPQKLGWDKEALLIATRQRVDNETNLITGEKNKVGSIQRILRECSISPPANWTSREQQRDSCSSGCAIQ